MSAARWVGALALGLVVAVGSADAVTSVGRWGDLGPLGPGGEIPEFAVALIDGGRFTDEDLAGRVHVVAFWATWCPYCRDELEEIDELIPTYDPQVVRFVAVNREGGGLSPREATQISRAYRDRTGLDAMVAVDGGAMARAFGVGPIPHTAIFDREGRLRFVHQGRTSGATLAEEIDELLAEGS